MKICTRGLNFIQVYDDYGNVRICGWTEDGSTIGNLVDNSFEEVFLGDKARKVRDRLACGDYSKCRIDECPWLSTGEISQHMSEITEYPSYPEWLYLAYENKCNYNCITCDIHERMLAADKKDLEKRYEKIEYELKKVLPYIKRISANGQGELFACDRILNLLSDWKPKAHKDQCSVTLETNGSLFDEKHWEKIQNIGQYNLTVAVTIMSFNEPIYQRLSGTKLPISRIEENLRFIKKLREQGIINDLRLATVVQQSNFRELPEFTRRCIYEFGADYVRLRSFVPWGKRPLETEWFMDVRNPYHPDNDEYMEVMKDPIFKHPAVHDWSGGRATTLGPHPDAIKLGLASQKLKIQSEYINDTDSFLEKIKCKVPVGSKVVIYGLGDIGKLFFKAMNEQYKVEAFIDKFSKENYYKNVNVIKLDEIQAVNISSSTYVIVTPLGDTNNICNQLTTCGISTDKVIGVNDILGLCKG